VDATFKSAALAHGPRCIGVILSGPFSDGPSGLMTVKANGGLAVVQDPAEASFPSMPRSALTYPAVDHIASFEEIGPLLARLIAEPIGPAGRPSNARLGRACSAGHADEPTSSALASRVLH
jgi:two-component system chemotaxis response regulator CheB